MGVFSDTDLLDIQGFGIAGFNKDHQELMFVRFGSATAGRQLLTWLEPRTATAWEVGTFNKLFKEIKNRAGSEPLVATWLGVLISAAGYVALSVATSGLPAGPGTEAFKAGMAARAETIGDTGPIDQPSSWKAPFRPGQGVHMCIVIAADEQGDLNELVAEIGDHVSAFDCEVLFQERGATLPSPLTGHEHFGFRDGLSQPAITNYTTPAPTSPEPPAVPAGEFVLGYPDAADATAQTAGSLWTHGSFVVFRRLRQNVAAFREQAAAKVQGSTPAVNEDQTGASLIGRWPSGAPLELNPTSAHGADPGLTSNPNAFQYKEVPFTDDDGHKCPHFAHVRKANPRDETTPTAPADNPTRHRLIRRGIPYGPLLPAGIQDDGIDRGLHFFCVVADVVRQFEFVQSSWLNQVNFPGGQKTTRPGQYGPIPQRIPDGPDPVVGEHTVGEACRLVQGGGHEATIPIPTQLVNVTAGEYFFLPSLTALRAIAGGATA